MSGFKKCGIFPVNPSEITDRQLAPSKAFHTRTGEETGDTDVTRSPLFTPGKEEIYKKRYEEGYDIFDPDYTAWLKINHPTSVSSACAGSSSSATDLSSFQVLSSTSAASNRWLIYWFFLEHLTGRKRIANLR